jgi:hypothetical protein
MARMQPFMTSQIAASRRPDHLLWMVILAVATAVAILAPFQGFAFEWSSFSAPGAAALIAAGAAWVYRTRRPDPRLASALEGTAQLLVFAAVAAPLSYIGASLGLPLQDRMFDTADGALGLNWPALLEWMNAHPSLHPGFRMIYLSLMPQTLVVVLALALSRQFVRLQTFLLAFFIAALATIAIAAVLPAAGVWGYHHLHAADYANITPATRSLHLPVFYGLRDGSFRLLMATGAEGIITFPSLHSALAVLLVVALWGIPVLRWVGLALNGLMLVSIPVDGGHYFIDVFAGIAIAWASLVVARDLTAVDTLAAARPILETE